MTIEQSVATPLEQQMNGVDKMLYLTSTNANDGTMTLAVTFDVESEVNIDQVNAQNRVAQAQANLPADVNQYGLTYRSTVGLPLIVFALNSPKGSYDSLFLGNYALINVNDALYRVRGVGQVINFGVAEYSMRIWVKPDALAKLGLTVPDLVRAVREQSTVNPSGRVGGEPSPRGQQLTYSVRSQGRLVTAEEFGRVVVRLTPDGLGGAARGRGAHRARRHHLQPVGALRRPPERARGRLPGARARTRSRWPRASRRRWRSSRPASRATSTTRWGSTPRCR